MTRDATTGFVRAVVDEWVRAGLEHAVVAPGSRSTPLALALVADGRVAVHVVLDERAAGFLGLGAARATGRPALLLCTSGTAAAGFHAAVLEADHGRVPLLVCTADRPPELRGVGAAQTIDQAGLYGGAVRMAVDVPPPEDRADAPTHWRALAARAWSASVGSVPGPVHLNLAFREPLVPDGAPVVDAPGRAGGTPWTHVEPPRREPAPEVVADLAAWAAAHPRGLVVAGWGSGASAEVVGRFAARAGWPVLPDPLSGLRVPGTISTYDALLREPRFAGDHGPDAVLRLGAVPTSKLAASLLGPPADVVRVDPVGAWIDPTAADHRLVVAEPDAVLGAVAERLAPGGGVPRAAWLTDWSAADAAARCDLDAHLDADDEPFEGRVARDLFAALPPEADLFVASSMPVRDLDSFAAPRDGVRVFANRGVNGIDGLVSSALGVALGAPDRPTVALLGDLALLHDANGLLGARDRAVDLVLVVVDNDGGGIFSFLPQADLPEHFERLFGTPHGVDLGALAGVHGIPVTCVARASALAPAVADALAAGGVRLVHVRTDRARNVARHAAAFAAATRTWTRGAPGAPPTV